MIYQSGIQLKRLVPAEDGATAVEYAVMLAMIITVVIVTVMAIGVNVNQLFVDFTTQFTAAS
jgi:Flp pilus assembly pilin Flp